MAIINSGFKAFDKQANGRHGIIARGNVISNTQVSGYIRGRLNTENCGQSFPEGALRDFDIKSFGALPERVRRTIMDATEHTDRPVILYRIQHYRRRHGSSSQETYIHGFIVTRPNEERNTDSLLLAYRTGALSKSEAVLQAVCEVLADPLPSSGPVTHRSHLVFDWTRCGPRLHLGGVV
jgi:hypothetical protein